MSAEKITFVIVRNALDPEVSTTVQMDYVAGRPVSEYLVEHVDIENVTLVVAVNGLIAADSDAVTPRPGDIVSITAYYEASAIAAFVAVAVGATAGSVAYYAVYGITYLAASYLIMTGLSMLVSAISPKPEQPGLDMTDESPTYSWGDMTPTYAEGLPIPVVFGTHKIAGQIINQFTKVGNDGKEYLYTQLAVNDGAVDSITDIRINDQPYTQYSGVTAYSRLGTLDQEPIPGFDEVTETHAMGVMLRTGVYNTRTTDGDQVQKVTVVLTCPAGLYYSNDDGGLDSRSVDIRIEYRDVSGSGFWITHKIERISGATTQSIRRAVEIDGLDPAQYEVRVTRVSGETTNFREKTDCYWTSVSESVKHNLSYPGIALYAVIALATDQLSGSAPSFTCVINRAAVSVYNPYSGLWVEKDASNPAWATYGLMVNHHEIDHTKMIFDEFDAWGAYCDEQIDGTPRFRCGVVLDTQTNIWSNVQRIAHVGRATVMRRGASYGVFLDAPVAVVSHVFNVANIVEGSYSLKYLPVKDRANAIEVTYCDPDRDYSSQIAAVYSDDYNDSDSVDKKTSVQIYAAVSRAQAFRDAAYALNSNRRLTKTIVLKAAFDSFTCTVGDLAYFQHVVPNYAGRSGGRLVSAENIDGGTSRVQLDRSVTLEAGSTYAVLVRLADDTLVEKVVQAVAETTETDTLELTSSFTSVPETDDIFIFGLASTYKAAYRVIRVAKDQQNIASITMLNYDEAIYEADGFAIEEDEYDLPVAQQALNVQARERLVYTTSGDFASVVDLNWSSATEDVGSNWTVYLEDITRTTSFGQTEGGLFVGADDITFAASGDQVGAVKVTDTSSTHHTIPSDMLTLGQRYKITVAPYGSGAVDTGSNSISLEVLGKLAPPSDVILLSAEWDSSRRSVVFTWPEITDIDAAGYEIRQQARGYGVSWDENADTYNAIGTDPDSWDTAEVLGRVGLGGSWVWLVRIGTVGTGTFLIKAVDTSGIYSENHASANVDIDTGGTVIEVPTGLELSTSATIADDGTAKVFIYADWDANAELSQQFDRYAVQLEDTATGRVTDHASKSSEYQWEVIGNKQYSAKVQAVDANGNRTAWCEAVSITSARDTGAPDAPQWKSTALVPGFKVMALQWEAGSEADLAHYEVQRSTIGAFGGEEVSLGNKSGSFTTDTELDVSTMYFYRIRAVDTSGNVSGWSSVEYATTLAIGSSDIAYNSVLASHINVDNLSAIAANIGEVVAGIMRSADYDADSGMQIDLTNGVIKLGGSAAPAFEWDGSSATIRNSAEGQSIELSGAQMTLGNTTDGDYFTATSGDIAFYRYINGAHRYAKSIKRVEYGVANNGTHTTLAGYWRNAPSVMVSPYMLDVFSASYSGQTQQLICRATSISETSPGSGVWGFTPEAILGISAGSASYSPSQSVEAAPTYSSSDYGSAVSTGATITTLSGVNRVVVNGVYSGHGSLTNSATGSGPSRVYMRVAIIFDGVEHIVATNYTHLSSSAPCDVSGSWFFDSGAIAATTHTIGLKVYADSISRGYFDQYTWARAILSTYTIDLASSQTLAQGSLNYIAIGE